MDIHNVKFFTGKYGDPEVTRWCKSSKAVKEIRNECMTDKQCLDNAQSQCDNDPNCFGVSWLPYSKTEDLKLCLSKEMEPKTDGWRTMMKLEGNQKKNFLNIEIVHFKLNRMNNMIWLTLALFVFKR